MAQFLSWVDQNVLNATSPLRLHRPSWSKMYKYHIYDGKQAGRQQRMADDVSRANGRFAHRKFMTNSSSAQSLSINSLWWSCYGNRSKLCSKLTLRWEQCKINDITRNNIIACYRCNCLLSPPELLVQQQPWEKSCKLIVSLLPQRRTRMGV